MDFKLQLIVVPVSDMDAAKDFYTTQAGFRLDVDHRAGEDFRVIQLTPPGSSCSISLMRNEAPGSLQGLHLAVTDIEAARAELVGRGDVLGPGPGHVRAAGEPEPRAVLVLAEVQARERPVRAVAPLGHPHVDGVPESERHGRRIRAARRATTSW